MRISKFYVKRFQTDYANKMIIVESGMQFEGENVFEDMGFFNYTELNANTCNQAFEMAKNQLIAKVQSMFTPVAQEVSEPTAAPEVTKEESLADAILADIPVVAPKRTRAPAKPKVVNTESVVYSESAAKEFAPVVESIPEVVEAPVVEVAPIITEVVETVVYNREVESHKKELSRIISSKYMMWTTDTVMKAKAKNTSEAMVGFPIYKGGNLVPAFTQRVLSLMAK